ncbi:HAD-IA family hydrolase [Arthrobacter sp.]|uniref:HAD-IA family hydrolase n=1 Tax=Arthrobacter sp. TaxID=1667 RepID=UPI00289EE3A5|nr:HAD-IA family hydrolase [Arthrobacter sp.]
MDTLSLPGNWYLFDYGMVISTAPLQEDWDALHRATGLDLRPPSSRYWAGREGFDAGVLSPEAYWSGVLGRPAAEGESARLESLDAAMWSHLNPVAVDVLQTLHGEGANLALLSNMPAGMSRRYEAAATWPGYFSRLFFSGRLGMVKPDPRIFKHVLADLGAAPANIVFIDDNAANIAAAGSLGFQTILHAEGTDLQRELLALRDDF